jgi:hypothetical protein
MAQVRIHNITDRPNVPTPAYAVTVGGQQVRPGKFITLDDSLLSLKFKKLHGSAVWIGQEVPKKYKATSKAALRSLSGSSAQMDIAQAREYLSSLEKTELLTLCGKMSPVLSFAKEPSSRMLVVKIARAAFSDSKILDPASFLWLRRWEKSGSAYIERS